MRLAVVLVGLLAASVVTSGHDVITTPITFDREISRLFYDRCAECHRPGGMAFSLLSYEEARPWATAIKEEVLERRMPPWGAVKGFGDFRDDRGLTQEQIELISEWVEGGAPEGEPKLLPKTPEFRNPAPARLQPGIAVEGPLTLKSGIRLAGIQPVTVSASDSVRVTAVRPDGSVEPLLWLYQYKSKFPHVYWYRSPIRLEASTRIEVSPPGAATFKLVSKAPGR